MNKEGHMLAILRKNTEREAVGKPSSSEQAKLVDENN
jgi:hypothetical protein